MQKRCIVIDYDIVAYPFHKVLSKYVFRVKHLNKLHEYWKHQTGRAELNYHDNLTLRDLMQRLPDSSLFYTIYHKWIRDHLAPHYNQISYTAHPKMRVHLSGTGCVSDFHKDVDITGRDEQINCYLPFTDVYNSCSLMVESEYDSEEYKPVNLKYGQALLWDGGHLNHGTQHNDTVSTRVSCDFRFHPLDISRVKSPWSEVLIDRPVHTSNTLIRTL